MALSVLARTERSRPLKAGWAYRTRTLNERGAALADYFAKADRVRALAETAISGFFGDGEHERAARNRHARVLWSGLYGVCALAEQSGDGGGAKILVETLIDTYIDGLRSRWGGAHGVTGGAQWSY